MLTPHFGYFFQKKRRPRDRLDTKKRNEKSFAWQSLLPDLATRSRRLYSSLISKWFKKKKPKPGSRLSLDETNITTHGWNVHTLASTRWIFRFVRRWLPVHVWQCHVVCTRDSQRRHRSAIGRTSNRHASVIKMRLRPWAVILSPAEEVF